MRCSLCLGSLTYCDCLPLMQTPKSVFPPPATSRWKTRQNGLSESKPSSLDKSQDKRKNLPSFIGDQHQNLSKWTPHQWEFQISPSHEANWNYSFVGLCLCSTLLFSFLWQITLLDSTHKTEAQREQKRMKRNALILPRMPNKWKPITKSVYQSVNK